MAETISPVDIFKFIALRPPQPPSTELASASQIRDLRTESQDGQSELAQVAGELSTAEKAMSVFKSANIDELKPIADQYFALVRNFSDPSAGDDGESGVLPQIDFDDVDETIEPKAWNALYAAYLTGPGAGRHLDIPLAVLRLLHAQKTLPIDEPVDRAWARKVLFATPIIPKILTARDGLKKAAKKETPENTDSNTERAMSRLVEDIVATQSLLDSARATPARRSPEVRVQEMRATDSERAEPNGEEVEVRRTEAAIRGAPSLADGLKSRISGQQNRVLSQLSLKKTSSIPKAVRTLEAHLGTLLQKASGMKDSQSFSQIVLNSGNVALAKVLPYAVGPASKYIPYIPVLNPALDVNVTGRIKPLGVGDLKVVKQVLLAYEPGEVAHIENVLKGEHKERVHRALDRTENTLFVAEEENQETERDTQSTDRFEVKREAETTIKEDMSVEAGVSVTASYGPVSVTAHGDFAYALSKEESTKNSSNFSRDVVDRAVSKIQKRVRTERTTKTLHEIEETNTHGIDNEEGAGHVTGVYRWVDKRYRAQVYNYGIRMMIEFIIPEPAAFFRQAAEGAKVAHVGIEPPVPFKDLSGGDLTPFDIDPTNYQIYTARYHAEGVSPPPPEYLYIGTAFEQNSIADGQTFSKSVKDITIPEGYIWDHHSAVASIVWGNYPQFSLQVGGNSYHLLNNTTARQALAGVGGGVFWGGDWEDDPRGVFPVSALGYDINAYTVHVEMTCRRTRELLEKWQLQTYEKIGTAYRALKTSYDQKLSQAQANKGAVIIEGRNPGINRAIEKRELKRLCITMMTGKHFNDNDAVVYPSAAGNSLPEVNVLEALSEGPYAQFFEQAFDWDQMTYLFYPYYWGSKDRWSDLIVINDPDPVFTNFLQSGSARVVVPVTLSYNDAVLYFLEHGLIWEGGEAPRLDDPLYVSISDEIKQQTDDLAGAIPEGDPWEFIVPTSLVWLQENSDLPVFET